jgi:hypothetical protein
MSKTLSSRGSPKPEVPALTEAKRNLQGGRDKEEKAALYTGWALLLLCR